ncbi:TetR/AcrR family transcriptional regulator [Geodermatophilus sp. URMC 64]
MSGTRRSVETKAAILAAARTRFAAEGYRSASIRAVARDVGVDPALVVRYFGSKPGLFAAATDIDLRIPDLADEPADEHGERLVEHFLSRWDADTPEGQVLLSLLRSAAGDAAAAAGMRELFARQLVPALRRVIPHESDVPQRAALVASQILGLALARSVLELPPFDAMPPNVIAATVGATVQRYLHEPMRPGRGGRITQR